jgi:hypothetical protein
MINISWNIFNDGAVALDWPSSVPLIFWRINVTFETRAVIKFVMLLIISEVHFNYWNIESNLIFVESLLNETEIKLWTDIKIDYLLTRIQINGNYYKKKNKKYWMTTDEAISFHWYLKVLIKNGWWKHRTRNFIRKLHKILKFKIGSYRVIVALMSIYIFSLFRKLLSF